MKSILKNCSIIVALLIFSIGSALSAHADTVVLTEGFEGVAGGNYFAGTTVNQFTVQSGAVEVLASSNDFGRCAAAGGSPTCINLDGALPGSTFTGTTFVSTNFFGPGTYDLFFDLAGSQAGDFNQGDTNTMFLFFGEILNSPIVLAPDAAFSTYSFLGVTVAPGTSSRVVFFQPDAGGAGNLLDNVRLVQRDAAAPVPEPATMTLLITGLAGLGTAVRKRRQANKC